MHLNSALVALVVALIPSIRARSIPLDTQYRAASLGSHKSDPQEHPIAGTLPLFNHHACRVSRDTSVCINATALASFAVAGPLSDALPTPDSCTCAHDLSSLLHTRFLVKSLGMEDLQQILGVYITSSPYSRTCTYPQPKSTTDDVCGFLCTLPLVSTGDHCTLPAAEGNLAQSAPPAACGANLRRLAKLGKPSTLPTYASNETACGSVDGSANGFKYVGTETRPDSCEGCTVSSAFKGRYESRLTGTDCAAISHADAVSYISGRCAVQSCLTRWSVDDDDTGCVEDIPHTSTPVDQGSQTGLSHESRRVLAYEFQQNATGADHVRPHVRWIPRGPDTHWPEKRDTDRSAHVRDVPAHDDRDQRTRLGPGHLKEDWTRIPDYRRHQA
ncbi:hypothetical protein LXA43DRAFT_14060 [Ganoderma leucocontextum]|nr:hypothetical protein LXA43DRAFT_14060 [Ganoderma leucocontextum]